MITKMTKKSTKKVATKTKKVAKAASKKKVAKKTTKKKTVKSKTKRDKNIVKRKAVFVIPKEKKKSNAEAKLDISPVKTNATTGVYDENGNWNGSLVSDEVIESIKDPAEKSLRQEIDSLEEEVRTIAEEHDPDNAYYLSEIRIKLMEKRRQLDDLIYKRNFK